MDDCFRTPFYNLEWLHWVGTVHFIAYANNLNVMELDSWFGSRTFKTKKDLPDPTMFWLGHVLLSAWWDKCKLKSELAKEQDKFLVKKS